MRFYCVESLRKLRRVGLTLACKLNRLRINGQKLIQMAGSCLSSLHEGAYQSSLNSHDFQCCANVYASSRMLDCSYAWCWSAVRATIRGRWEECARRKNAKDRHRRK